MKKKKSASEIDPKELEAKLKTKLEKKLRAEVEKDVRMDMDEKHRKSMLEDVRKNYTKKIKDLERHIYDLKHEKKDNRRMAGELKEHMAEDEQRIAELERQINSAEMKRIFIHNEFKNRLFEILCEIGIEQMEFSNVTRQTLVEERILHMTQKNPLYKSAKEAKRKEMCRAAEDEAMYFYDTHYKSHGLFLLYGDAFSVLKEDHSKAMTVSDREERLLEFMVPSNIFISEEGTRTALQKLAPMDGAICIDTFGTVQAAGRYIIVNREISSKITPYTGFGSKNITAQGITKELHNVCGITLSGRSKIVRLFENGKVVKTFEPEEGKLSHFKGRVLTEQFFFDTNNYFIRSKEFDNNVEILNAMLREHLKRGQEAKTLTVPFINRLKALFGHSWQVNAAFHMKDGKALGITLENVETRGDSSRKKKKTRKGIKSAKQVGKKKQEVLKIKATSSTKEAESEDDDID